MINADEELVKERDIVAKKLQKLSEETGYNIVQKHGQRIYGGPPPNWTGPVPGRGTELYIFMLPRDCFEDELVPVLSSVGSLYELRMMIEFSGASRGYCYVRYSSLAEAEKAKVAGLNILNFYNKYLYFQSKLNNYEIRPMTRIRVTKSVDNQKILVKLVPSLPFDLPNSEILGELQRLIEGVVRVKRKDIRWLEVEFHSHRGAALARRLLVPGNIKMFNYYNIVQVDWADPDIVGAFNGPQKRKLYVRGFRKFVPEEMKFLLDFFNSLCEGQVNEIMTGSSYGFITFHTEEAARLVMEKKDNLFIDGEKVKLDWWTQTHRRRQNPGPIVETRGQPGTHSGSREELLSLSRAKGWGNPQYSLETFLDRSQRLCYQYSVTFPFCPVFKVSGEVSTNKHQAFIRCISLAIDGAQMGSFQSYRVPPSLQYIPHTAPLAGTGFYFPSPPRYIPLPSYE